MLNNLKQIRKARNNKYCTLDDIENAIIMMFENKDPDEILYKTKVTVISTKSQKHSYSKQQITKAVELLLNKNNTDLNEISEITNLAKRKLKMIRYILNNSIDKSIMNLLFTCRYLISSLENIVKKQKQLTSKIKKENSYEN
jgi:hypothetical protein